MYDGRRDLVAISSLMLTAALSVWIGIAGPLFEGGFISILEKWQTIWAALIALAAAYVAVRPVYKQLAEQRRQSAAAAVTMIVKAAVALEEERTIVRRAYDDLRKLGGLMREYNYENIHRIYHSWPNEAYTQIDLLDEMLRTLKLYSERNPNPTPTQEHRMEAVAVLDQLRRGLADLALIIRQNTSGLNYEDGEEEIPENEHESRRELMDRAIASWDIAKCALEKSLSADIAVIWRRIRELERIAIGSEE